jgi:hypothetical protein
VTEVQITRWREIPSMVAARESDEIVKVSLPQRFQEAIDEAAMRAGASDADAYMDGWTRDAWAPVDGTPAEAAEAAAAALEDRWTPEALTALLDAYGSPA